MVYCSFPRCMCAYTLYQRDLISRFSKKVVITEEAKTNLKEMFAHEKFINEWIELITNVVWFILYAILLVLISILIDVYRSRCSSDGCADHNLYTIGQILLYSCSGISLIIICYLLYKMYSYHSWFIENVSTKLQIATHSINEENAIIDSVEFAPMQPEKRLQVVIE